jgi:hypothetical protein
MRFRSLTALEVVLLVVPLLCACGRSDFFGEIGGSLSGLPGGGPGGSSSGEMSNGSGSGRSATSAGSESSGTAGSGSTNAGDISGGSTSSGQGSSGSGTTAGRTSGTGSSTGATGKSSSGTGGSGSTTGVSCNKEIGENDRAKCKTNKDCGCPDTCVSDPPLGMDCERPCAQLKDCGDLGYLCNGTYCQFNECGPGTGNGSFNSFCDVAGTNDGTCIPLTVGGVEVGQCFQGGASTTCCNSTDGRTGSSSSMLSVCVAGAICSGGTTGECGPVCDPMVGGCPPGDFCAFEVNDSLTGGCFGPTSVCPSNN